MNGKDEKRKVGKAEEFLLQGRTGKEMSSEGRKRQARKVKVETKKKRVEETQM